MCSIMLKVRYLAVWIVMLIVSYLSLCSIMLAGAAFSFSVSSSFLVLKRQNLSSQSEPAVSVSWFRASVATPRTVPLWAGTEALRLMMMMMSHRTDQFQLRTDEHTFVIVAKATAVQAGLQVVDVDPSAWRANHGKVAAGSDVDSLWIDRMSYDP